MGYLDDIKRDIEYKKSLFFATGITGIHDMKVKNLRDVGNSDFP